MEITIATFILLAIIITIMKYAGSFFNEEEKSKRPPPSNNGISHQQLGFIFHRMACNGMESNVYDLIPVKIDTTCNKKSLVELFKTNSGFAKKHLISIKAASGLAYATIFLELSKEHLIDVIKGINGSIGDMTSEDGIRLNQNNLNEISDLVIQYSKLIIIDITTNKQQNQYSSSRLSALFIKYMAWGFGDDNSTPDDYSIIEILQIREYIDNMPLAIISTLSNTVKKTNQNMIYMIKN